IITSGFNRYGIEYKEILFLFSWSIGYGVSAVADMKSAAALLRAGDVAIPSYGLLRFPTAFSPIQGEASRHELFNYQLLIINNSVKTGKRG
ncbi:hypothetical protein, partial [Dapis sp. BLCC M229]|uniref:hypothetical protein n=1 Tax=Dapis sp. BLCC M229 TaxID=3400188 RepID=UPI003CEFF077